MISPINTVLHHNRLRFVDPRDMSKSSLSLIVDSDLTGMVTNPSSTSFTQINRHNRSHNHDINVMVFLEVGEPNHKDHMAAKIAAVQFDINTGETYETFEDLAITTYWKYLKLYVNWRKDKSIFFGNNANE